MAYTGDAKCEVGPERSRPCRVGTLGPRTWQPWVGALSLERKGGGALGAQRASLKVVLWEALVA